MDCSFQNDDFLYIVGSVTEDEVALANKIYELSENLEKALFDEDPDTPEFLRLEEMKAWIKT
jgi:hypothetical protein